MTAYKRWTRGQKLQLSPHFNTKEFTCSCGLCVNQVIHEDLVLKLEKVREEMGTLLTITSGYRCARKQQMLRDAGYETAIGQSRHEMGQAADICAEDMTRLLATVDRHFNTYGISKAFIHVDTRPDKLDGTKRIWGYKK